MAGNTYEGIKHKLKCMSNEVFGKFFSTGNQYRKLGAVPDFFYHEELR